MEADHLYFCRRAKEEREAAMKAAHPAARVRHVEMADRYDEMAAAIASHHTMIEEQTIRAV